MLVFNLKTLSIHILEVNTTFKMLLIEIYDEEFWRLWLERIRDY